MKDYVLLAQQIREYRKREGLTRNGFCEMVGLNFTSYAHIEPTDNKPIPDRPIGLKIYKLLAKYFLYVGDIKMILALLEYAALDPVQLHRVLDAEMWHLLPKLPESNRLIQFIFKGSDTKAQITHTATGIFASGKLWRFQGKWWPRDSMDGIDPNRIYTWRYLDEGFVPSEPSGATVAVPIRMPVADAWIVIGDELPRDYDKLPENLKHVNVTYIRCEGCKERVTRGYCTRGGISPQEVQWDLDGYGGVEETDDGFKIIAWQPLPEPLRVAGVAEAVTE